MAKDDTNETTEMWRALRRDQQGRRAARLPGRTADILALRDLGYRVRQLTEYQFRVEERLDLFPIHQRWHDVKANSRGRYVTPRAIAERKLGKVAP